MKKILALLTEVENYSVAGLVSAIVAGGVTAFLFYHFL
jgi:hypothetical protein